MRRVQPYAQYARNRLRKLKINKLGYCETDLSREGQQTSFLVHRLVVIAFFGPISEAMTVNHKNRDKSDNRIDNLEIVTQSENLIHARRVLNHGWGDTSSRAILTSKQVRQIRRYRAHGMGLHEIAELYGVTKQAIWLICHRKNWKHI